MDPFRKLYYTLLSVANHPLNQGSQWRAVRDFCVAQVAVRMIPGDVCVPFPNETRLLIPPQMKGAAHFISPGLCEFDEMCFVAHFLKPGELFADVGANVGAFTVLASGVAQGRTISFEPSPRTFAFLSRNIALNEIGSRAKAIHAAAGARPGKLRLTENLGTENYVCPDGENGGVEVNVTTLDASLVDECPDLMKVDVEGFESEVFAGASQLLGNPKLKAMIVERTSMGNRYGYDESALHSRIQKEGFIPCAYSAMDRRLTQVANHAQGNIIYLRNHRDAESRIKNASAFSFRGKKV